ncbi:MAG: MaoC family dehydratase [Mesorhizobium sp.]
MQNLEPVSIDDVVASVGQEIGTSPWRVVTQEIIDRFADATDDHQFIHVDPVRAAAETPYGGTIAHGFLLVSLLSAMTYETLPPLKGASRAINQGFEKLRFVAPVKAGARIRTRFVLGHVRVRPSGFIELEYDVTIELENSPKPALTARWLTIAVQDNRE